MGEYNELLNLNVRYPKLSVAPLSFSAIAKSLSFWRITWSCDLGVLNLSSIVSGVNPSAAAFQTDLIYCPDLKSNALVNFLFISFPSLFVIAF